VSADPVRSLRRVVAFDVDGTLTTRDCVVPFLRRVAGSTTLYRAVLRHPVRSGRAVAARDRDALKALAAAAVFAGRDSDAVDRLGVEFARTIVGDHLRDETVAALRAHQADGDATVLVSASFETYLRPLAELLDVDDALGARLEVDDRGVLTGELDGANCRGPEKVARLHEWLGAHVGGRPAVELVAYGDSSGDRELLADADIAHWVGRYRP
jgi:phosphatidylglycerophosphatase C